MKQLKQVAAAAVLGLASLACQAANVAVDVSGASSVNLLGEAGNTVWQVDIGANMALTSLQWTLSLNAFSPSALSEMQVSFGNSSGTNLLTFTPGAADPISGNGSYSGTLDLTGYGVGSGADGKLRIEFSEAYKDLATGVAEGRWVSGNLTFGVSAVPEPGGLLLAVLGLGVLVPRLRRASRD
jgi:hypothetical protein